MLHGNSFNAIQPIVNVIHESRWPSPPPRCTYPQSDESPLTNSPQKAELGRHAYEQRMPDKIAQLIARETPSNKLSNVIPFLANFLSQDPAVAQARLCTPHAVQISKLSAEGNHFCGYRNIQMLLAPYEDTLSIPDLQAAIEASWTAGHNSHAALETGGILNTRKHVGPSEAQALLVHRGTPTQAKTFTGHDAHTKLLDYAWAHFAGPEDGPVTVSNAPPIFLQRPRHSLTIVGVELLPDGKRRLLVFDPGYEPPASVKKCISGARTKMPSSWDMKVYRRGERHLRMWSGFETITIVGDVPDNTSS